VALTNVVLTAKTEKGPDAFRAERVVFETPNVLWVIKHGLLNETTLPAHLGIAVQGLNVVRLISLFYLGQWDLRVFEWAHLYVWQALIMLDVLIVWLLWVRMLPALAPVTEPARA